MHTIFAGRHSAHSDAPFVVFLIGIRFNTPWRVDRWWPHFSAMVPMLSELQRHPHKGLLGSKLFLALPTLLLVQYWRSYEDLEQFARNPSDPHLPAWKRFNQHIGASRDVGVFHETYLVGAGQYEAVYVNMPRFGLAQATTHVPATGPRLTARRRLGGHNEAAVASPDDAPA